MKRKTSIAAGGLVGVFGIVVIAGLLSSETLCACTDANENFSVVVGARPMKDEPAAVRRKLLLKLPAGSTSLEVRKFIATIAPHDGNVDTGTYRNGLCEKASIELVCQFEVNKEWWGKRQSGFKVHFVVDQADRLTNVKVVPYAVWIGG